MTVAWCNKIIIKFDVLLQLVPLIKTCTNETYSKVRLRWHLSDVFPVQNNPKQRDTQPPLILNFALEFAV